MCKNMGLPSKTCYSKLIKQGYLLLNTVFQLEIGNIRNDTGRAPSNTCLKCITPQTFCGAFIYWNICQQSKEEATIICNSKDALY